MKMVKSLLLGSAAGLVAMAGAQAADLPVKAKPVQYVKICSLYGAGFYYIPGTDTCIKIGGYVRAEVNFNAGGSFGVPTSSGTAVVTLKDNRNGAHDRNGVRVRLSPSTPAARPNTARLRSYMFLSATDDNSGRQLGHSADPGNRRPERLYPSSSRRRHSSRSPASRLVRQTRSSPSTITPTPILAMVVAPRLWRQWRGVVRLHRAVRQRSVGVLSIENAHGYHEGITNVAAGTLTTAPCPD